MDEDGQRLFHKTEEDETACWHMMSSTRYDQINSFLEAEVSGKDRLAPVGSSRVCPQVVVKLLRRMNNTPKLIRL